MPGEGDVPTRRVELQWVQNPLSGGIAGVGDDEKVGEAEIGLKVDRKSFGGSALRKTMKPVLLSKSPSLMGPSCASRNPSSTEKPDFTARPEIDAVEAIIVLSSGRMKLGEELGVGAAHRGIGEGEP
jgi:hypothetical protein